MPLRLAWGRVYGGVKIRRARMAFEGADAQAHEDFLAPELLAPLLARGYRPPDPIRYDEDGLAARAREKVEWIERHVPLSGCRVCVELGCWDGMVLAELRTRGQVALGADLARDGFDRRAKAAGAALLQCDASRLAIRAGSVDLVYSFAAFEHFADPAAVVDQAARVLRRGGYLYLFFGPVYTSPYGLHAYRQIPVPYCHFLFKEKDLRAYAARQGLSTSWPYVNRVSVTAYREIFTAAEPTFERMHYLEHPTGGVGAELIAAYPQCFRSKVPAFDDLLVSSVEICLRKR